MIALESEDRLTSGITFSSWSIILKSYPLLRNVRSGVQTYDNLGSNRTVDLACQQFQAERICIRYEVFFVLAARAFAAFFRLLLIMTMLKNDPTTAEPSSVNITGILIAQTRGGNRSCSGWPGSTKGYLCIR